MPARAVSTRATSSITVLGARSRMVCVRHLPFHTSKERILPPVTRQTSEAHQGKELARAGSSGKRERRRHGTARSRESVSGREKESLSIFGNRTFQVRCEPHDQRYALIATSGLSLFVAQRIRKDDLEQVWDSIIVRCVEEADGTLAVRVLISNPDWQELLQIAYICSRPDDGESLTALGCNLDHVSQSKI